MGQTLKNEHEALRAEFVQHVAWTNSIVDQLRQQKLDLAFEQIDKAIGLQKSVEKVEQGHQEIHRTLRGIQLPSLGQTVDRRLPLYSGSCNFFRSAQAMARTVSMH